MKVPQEHLASSKQFMWGQICLWICVEGHPRLTFLPSKPPLTSWFWLLTHFYDQTFTSLFPEWQRVNFVHYLRAPLPSLSPSGCTRTDRIKEIKRWREVNDVHLILIRTHGYYGATCLVYNRNINIPHWPPVSPTYTVSVLLSLTAAKHSSCPPVFTVVHRMRTVVIMSTVDLHVSHICYVHKMGCFCIINSQTVIESFFIWIEKIKFIAKYGK